MIAIHKEEEETKTIGAVIGIEEETNKAIQDDDDVDEDWESNHY